VNINYRIKPMATPHTTTLALLADATDIVNIIGGLSNGSDAGDIRNRWDNPVAVNVSDAVIGAGTGAVIYTQEGLGHPWIRAGSQLGTDSHKADDVIYPVVP
jgi:hypothetical protein